jgi:hypothetical protein
VARQFREAETDPELLSLRSEVALLQVRIRELLQRLYTGESGLLWQDLRRAYRGVESACRGNEALLCPVRSLGAVIDAGARDEEVWADLLRAVEAKGRAAAREWRRQADLGQCIPAERALVLVRAIVDSVTRHVPDPEVRRRISHDIGGILASVGGGR